jgi:hypothetical protein
MQDFKPLDPSRVNTVDPVEVNYWCKEFRCSEDELAKAVAEVGEHVAEVRPFLAFSGRPR